MTQGYVAYYLPHLLSLTTRTRTYEFPTDTPLARSETQTPILYIFIQNPRQFKVSFQYSSVAKVVMRTITGATTIF